jgi:choline dehydrogenase
MADAYDVVIVGAGSAGCVLAARLSEDPSRRVLLLEAGPDYPERASIPADIASAFRPTYSHDWGWSSAPGAIGRSLRLPRGKIVGGCSAMNAAAALRGVPADYDRWASLGNPGWSWADVLPVFRRMERDLDFDGPWHGGDGHLPIRRYRGDELTIAHRAFFESCERLGHAAVEDHNAPGAVGAGPLPVNAVDGVRQSAALGILAGARARPNLTVRGGVRVDQVRIERGRVTAIRIAEPREVMATDRVILAAGSYASPALLMRSGIGPAAHLRELGLPVVSDVPGIGENLVDHPLCGLTWEAPRELVVESPIPLFQSVLTLRASGSTGDPDLQVLARSVLATDQSPTGANVMLFAALLKPCSRGRVRLHSADPAAAPVIDLGFFSAPDDLARLLVAMRVARRIARTPPFSEIARAEIHPGAAVGDGDAELGAAVRARVETYHHPVGTCRMGPEQDPMAVVDGTGRVRAVDGLWVIDASIMPEIPSSNTHLPTTMVAERCAEMWIAAQR